MPAVGLGGEQAVYAIGPDKVEGVIVPVQFLVQLGMVSGLNIMLGGPSYTDKGLHKR